MTEPDQKARRERWWRPAPGEERTFDAYPPPAGWAFSYCPEETDDEETDGCKGCPGWGYECGAVWEFSPRPGVCP